MNNDLKAEKGFEILSTRKLTDYPYLNLFEIQYKDGRNQQKVWRVASRNDQLKFVNERFHILDAVIIVPYHLEQDKLVIIKEYRVSLGSYQYGFPAGLVDAGESIEETAARELYEETGLALKRLVKISPPIYSSSGLTDESISIAYAECSGDPMRPQNITSEDIYPLLVSPQEAGDMCGDANLKFDAKTWLVLSEYARTGKIY